MNQSDVGVVSTTAASNVTELKKLLDASVAERIVYEYNGITFEGVEVQAALAEAPNVGKDDYIRRRMMIFVPDELWIQIVKNVILVDDELRVFRHLSNPTLLSLRDCSYELSFGLFRKYEAGKNGKVYESNTIDGFKALLALAAQDNYPSRSGQPLFLMYSYEFNERYTASVKDGRLLVHIPSVVVDSIKIKFMQSRKLCI